MPTNTCPHCGIAMTRSEVERGVCGACGKKVPRVSRSAATPRDREAERVPEVQPTGPKKLGRGTFIGQMIAAIVGAVIFVVIMKPIEKVTGNLGVLPAYLVWFAVGFAIFAALIFIGRLVGRQFD